MSLDQNFDNAADMVNSLKKRPTDEELLDLYGLYKNSKDGNCNSSQPSLLFDMKGHYKWKAWKLHVNKSKDQTKKEYIDYVLKLVDKYGLK